MKVGQDKTTGYAFVSPLTYTGNASKGFTYQVPPNTEVKLGQVVKIPLGRRQSLGVVTKLTTETPEFTTKPIDEVLDIPPIPSHLVELAEWMAEYYFASPKSIWSTILPAGITKKRRGKPPAEPLVVLPQTQLLNSEQAAAFKAIDEGTETTYLVQGVTGSGKTRLYLELAAKQLEQGMSVIVLVPEIALTPQLIALFEASFPGRVISYFSTLTESQKHQAWDRAHRSSEPQVVIGPRSSLFLPLTHLGLIIVDECHETSYKQEQNPRYNAITVAARLAKVAGAKLILGSATPGLHEAYLSSIGRIKLLQLTKRTHGGAPPTTQIIDMRDKRQHSSNRMISKALLEALKASLEAGEQALLFINRRGSASNHLCNNCSHVSSCPSCHLPLTFHADEMKLICHICNYRTVPAAVCPDCGLSQFKFIGGGTKRIEAEIGQLLPQARIARLDKDSAKPKELPGLYRKLHSGEIDILIGTQMIAKGLDLPKLNTVGVITADTMLLMPDFSASERTFQLLSQVSGRAGRSDGGGQVFIQTYSPDHTAIQAAAKGDYWSFYQSELAQRKLLGYPPFRHLLKLAISHQNPDTASRLASEQYDKLKAYSQVKLLGPAPAFHERAGGFYHWHIVVKAASRAPLLEIAASLPSTWKTDLDPVNLL